jgi:hypothetical protein
LLDRCWQAEVAKRPSFEQIVDELTASARLPIDVQQVKCDSQDIRTLLHDLISYIFCCCFCLIGFSLIHYFPPPPPPSPPPPPPPSLHHFDYQLGLTEVRIDPPPAAVGLVGAAHPQLDVRMAQQAPWHIAFDELKLGDMIGMGSFGQVC